MSEIITIYILKENGEIIEADARKDKGFYFLLEDGVRVRREWVNNDGIHFDSHEKAQEKMVGGVDE